jgi:hypothetical protein
MPQQGFVISQYAKVGDIVAKGQPLYEIDISRNTTTGNVSAAQIEVINEKLRTLKISFKLSHNKEETRLSLDKQLKTINDSLKETNRMLVNAQTGLKKCMIIFPATINIFVMALSPKISITISIHYTFNNRVPISLWSVRKCNWNHR